tara:strand:- start:149 stop:982 length:834 start_codon:yes stop_codon:yes gene_type:complete
MGDYRYNIKTRCIRAANDNGNANVHFMEYAYKLSFFFEGDDAKREWNRFVEPNIRGWRTWMKNNGMKEHADILYVKYQSKTQLANHIGQDETAYDCRVKRLALGKKSRHIRQIPDCIVNSNVIVNVYQSCTNKPIHDDVDKEQLPVGYLVPVCNDRVITNRTQWKYVPALSQEEVERQIMSEAGINKWTVIERVGSIFLVKAHGEYHFLNGKYGHHSVTLTGINESDHERMVSHWQGYLESNDISPSRSTVYRSREWNMKKIANTRSDSLTSVSDRV